MKKQSIRNLMTNTWVYCLDGRGGYFTIHIDGKFDEDVVFNTLLDDYNMMCWNISTVICIGNFSIVEYNRCEILDILCKLWLGIKNKDGAEKEEEVECKNGNE